MFLENLDVSVLWRSTHPSLKMHTHQYGHQQRGATIEKRHSFFNYLKLVRFQPQAWSNKLPAAESVWRLLRSKAGVQQAETSTPLSGRNAALCNKLKQPTKHHQESATLEEPFSNCGPDDKTGSWWKPIINAVPFYIAEDVVFTYNSRETQLYSPAENFGSQVRGNNKVALPHLYNSKCEKRTGGCEYFLQQRIYG